MHAGHKYPCALSLFILLPLKEHVVLQEQPRQYESTLVARGVLGEAKKVVFEARCRHALAVPPRPDDLERTDNVCLVGIKHVNRKTAIAAARCKTVAAVIETARALGARPATTQVGAPHVPPFV